MNKNLSESTDHWKWVLALFTLGSFAETIFFGQISTFTPLYLPDLNVPARDIARWTGIIASLAGVLGLPFLPLWGALADRYARKPIIIRSFLVHMLAGVVSALAGNVWVFLLGRSISSFALGNSGLMLATLAERAPAKRQGLAFAIMNSAAPVGVFVGPLIGGPIVDLWGVRVLLTIDAFLMLGVVLAFSFGYRDHFLPKEHKPILQMAYDSLGILWRSIRLRTLFPALFLLFAGWIMAMTYVPVIVGELYTGTNLGTIVGAVMGAGGFLALLIGPGLGALADRFGHLRILIVGTLTLVIMWSSPLLTAGLFGFGIVWALINGLASGVFSISFNVLSNSTSPRMRGRVMSFAYLPINIGSILGPGLGAYLTVSNTYLVFPAAAVITGLGLWMLILANRYPVLE